MRHFYHAYQKGQRLMVAAKAHLFYLTTFVELAVHDSSRHCPCSLDSVFCLRIHWPDGHPLPTRARFYSPVGCPHWARLVHQCNLLGHFKENSSSTQLALRILGVHSWVNAFATSTSPWGLPICGVLYLCWKLGVPDIQNFLIYEAIPTPLWSRPVIRPSGHLLVYLFSVWLTPY